MGRKVALVTVLCLAVSLDIATCGSPKVPDSDSDEISKQPMPHATFFGSGAEWVKHAKTDKFKCWQVSRENTDKAVHLERAMGGTGEFVVREGQLCFNTKHEQAPAVLLSDYQASNEKIQINKNDFMRLGEKFKYNDGNYIGNISLIGLHGSEEKTPQEFTDSPCFAGEKYGRYVIIFGGSLSSQNYSAHLIQGDGFVNATGLHYTIQYPQGAQSIIQADSMTGIPGYRCQEILVLHL